LTETKKNTQAPGAGLPPEANAAAPEARTPEASAAEGKTKRQTPRNYIYIGPTAPGGALPSYKNFIGTRERVEEALADIIKAYPQVKNMIVPTTKLAESRIKAQNPDAALGKFYAGLKTAFAKKNKEG
jgi:hypothetical protein